MMNFLKRIFGRDEKFYELLEAGAQQAQDSAKLLLQFQKSLGTDATTDVGVGLRELIESRHKGKRVSGDVTKALCSTFVTPFEREDIEALESALYKIPKIAVKIGDRIAHSPVRVSTDLVSKQLEMLVKATGIVTKMVTTLRQISLIDRIKADYESLQAIEGEADKLILGELRELYRSDVGAKEMVILSDIYELLERSIDLCRDAGKVVFQVALKYA